jgi:uncharacterized protein (TIGR02145 family)
MLVTENKVLPVSLRHKFDYLKVRVDCSYNDWHISQINADSIRLKTYSAFTLDTDGDVSAGTAITRPLSWPSSLTANQIQESLGNPIYLSALDIYLGAKALTFSMGGRTPSTPSAATTFTFSTASFVAGGGKRYVLTLKVKQPLFASTNIYWNGMFLTFGEFYYDPVAQNQQKYQGVFFKFGSLVGISPQGTWGNSTTTLYVPKSPSASYETTAAGTHAEWTGTTYAAIPYVSAGSEIQNRNNRYVMDTVGTSQLAQMKGDICKYLPSVGHAHSAPPGKSWRLPTSAELGTLNNTWGSNGWIKVGSFGSYTTSISGGYDTAIPSGGNFGVPGNFFPASGHRDTEGVLYNTGRSGDYWSGSVYNATNGYALYFHNGGATTYHNADRQYAFAVRCVLE